MTAPSGKDVARLAHEWLGTPFCHLGSRKGIGCDCLGLVRGIWRELHGRELAVVPVYGGGWTEIDAGERLWQALGRHLVELPRDASLGTGQVLLFRMRVGSAARHLGILIECGPDEPARFIHAYEHHGVVESSLSAPWRRRIVARFEMI